MLVPHLPPESATSTAQRLAQRDGQDPIVEQPAPDPEAQPWGREHELLALIRDELQALRWLYESAKSDKRHQPKWKPAPLPRPGIAKANEPKRLAPEQYDVLAQHLRRTQGGDATYN